MGFYVKIEKPREFRRDVLEGSKKIITCLQSYRQLLAVREQKNALLNQLRNDMKELGLLISKLDKLLPEKHLREEALAKKKVVKKKATTREKKTTTKKTRVKKNDQKKSKEEQQPVTSVSEVDKLNQALASIEEKLSQLR